MELGVPLLSCEIWLQSTAPTLTAERHLVRFAANRELTLSYWDPASGVRLGHRVGPNADEATESVGLLYVPAGQRLDLGSAERFARHCTADTLGVLTDPDGVLLSRVGAAALARFCAPRGAQDDESVYTRGAEARLDYEVNGTSVPPPRQLYLGITQKCDRSCTFCVSRSFEFDLLSLDEIRRIGANLHGDVDIIALTGAGEAMTHPQFWDAMDLLGELFPRARYKMNTSGVSLVRRSARLLGYPVKNITVSLNATTEDTYRRFVGKGLDVVLRGIAALSEARVAAGRDDLRLCLSMVLMNSTLPELPDLVRLAFQLGVEEIQGINLMLNDDSLAHESPFHRQDEANEWLDAAAQVADRLGVLASLPPRFGQRAATGRDQATSLPTSHGHRCIEVFSTAYLRPNGEVTPCPYFDETVGDTRGASLSEIWNGPEYERIRASLRDGDPLPQCRHCCGFSEGGLVDDYRSHWLGTRGLSRSLPIVEVR